MLIKVDFLHRNILKSACLIIKIDSFLYTSFITMTRTLQGEKEIILTERYTYIYIYKSVDIDMALLHQKKCKLSKHQVVIYEKNDSERQTL